MQSIRFIWVVFLLSLFNMSVVARDIRVTVQLTDIVANKVSEKSGDEVYVSVTEYSSLGHNSHTRIPIFPNHWLSQNLDKVKNQNLWKGAIEEGEAYELIISLVEHDIPPWNVDDHIGSVKVILSNKGSKLSVIWGSPDFVGPEKITRLSEDVPRFTLQGSESKYTVGFYVKEGT